MVSPGTGNRKPGPEDADEQLSMVSPELKYGVPGTETETWPEDADEQLSMVSPELRPLHSGHESLFAAGFELLSSLLKRSSRASAIPP